MKVSFASSMVSWIVGTEIVIELSVGVNVSVLDVGVV